MSLLGYLIAILAWCACIGLIVVTAVATVSCCYEIRRLWRERHAEKRIVRLIGPRAGDLDTAHQEYTADADGWDITPSDRTWLTSKGMRA